MLLLLLLLPVVAEEDAYDTVVYIHLLLHTKLKIWIGNIPKTIPVALPEQQRRCVVMVGYIEKTDGDSKHA